MRKLTNLVQKVASAGLAFAMACGMCTTVLANNLTADNNIGKITVNNVEEDTTVKIYKIIDLELDTTDDVVTPDALVWNDNVSAAVTEINADYIDATTGEVTETFKALESAADTSYTDAKAFYDALAAKLTDTALTSSKTATGTSVEFTGLEMGQYLIVVDGGAKIYNTTVASVVPEYSDTDGWVLSDVTVDAKSSDQPELTKTSDKKTVKIGDVITYTITVNVPQFDEGDVDKSFKIAVTDKQGSGLTLDPNTVAVTCDGKALAADGNYTFTDTSTTENGFKIEFTDAFLSNTSNYIGKTIVITYESTVNENAFSGGANALKNTATLDYGKDSTPSTDTDVYTYGLDLTKVAKGDHNTTLEGAEFELKNSDGTTLYFTEDDGVYTYAGTTASTGLTSVLTTASDGTLKVQGIDVGTYTLTETKAPTDYALPSGSITFTLTDAQPDGVLDDATTATCTGTAGLVDGGTVDANSLKITVENSDNSFWTLPKTGDVGTIVYAFAGLVIMGTAAAFLIHYRKKNSAQ